MQAVAIRRRQALTRRLNKLARKMRRKGKAS